MKQYIVEEVVNFSEGTILELSEKQHKDREQCLKKLGGNKYEVLKTVQFKIGEIIGLDGELDKGMQSKVTLDGGHDKGLQNKINQYEVKKEAKKHHDIKN